MPKYQFIYEVESDTALDFTDPSTDAKAAGVVLGLAYVANAAFPDFSATATITAATVTTTAADPTTGAPEDDVTDARDWQVSAILPAAISLGTP